MRLNYNDLKEEYRLTWDQDSWGTCMHWLFTIAEILNDFGEVPNEGQFKPSPIGNTNDPDDYVKNICESSDIESLRHFGETLFRLSQLQIAAGLDY